MVSGFVFDPSRSGLRKTLKEYQQLAIRYVWEAGADGADSGQTWRHVKERLRAGRSISQSSIINFLNRMVDEGVLSFRDATKKGGHAHATSNIDSQVRRMVGPTRITCVFI